MSSHAGRARVTAPSSTRCTPPCSGSGMPGSLTDPLRAHVPRRRGGPAVLPLFCCHRQADDKARNRAQVEGGATLVTSLTAGPGGSLGVYTTPLQPSALSTSYVGGVA